MAEKTGASLQKQTTFVESAPAELFIPATDHGAADVKPKVAKAKPQAPHKTEHTQMDLEDYLRVLRTLGVQDDKR